jgi:hypothetical protein
MKPTPLPFKKPMIEEEILLESDIRDTIPCPPPAVEDVGEIESFLVDALIPS